MGDKRNNSTKQVYHKPDKIQQIEHIWSRNAPIADHYPGNVHAAKGKVILESVKSNQNSLSIHLSANSFIRQSVATTMVGMPACIAITAP